jgi:hypothetical protein
VAAHRGRSAVADVLERLVVGRQQLLSLSQAVRLLDPANEIAYVALGKFHLRGWREL